MSKLISSLKQYQQDPVSGSWSFVFPKTPKRKGQCKVIYCARVARTEVRRTRTGIRTVTHAVCPTCQSRLYRANNPAKEIYRQIKDRAHRRGQVFSLSFEEFVQAIEGTNYLSRRGTGLNDLHFDREEVWRGYSPGNVRVITAAENLRKQREVDHPFL